MADNSNLKQANKAKKDEFYTQMVDIEKEIKHYKEFFQNKVVFCNCDDPYESNFFKYFALNFNFLGLKKLIATCYSTSPIKGEQLSLFDIAPLKIRSKNDKQAYKIEITHVPDSNNDKAIDLTDVEYLLKHEKNILTTLKGDGDFRSEECIKLLEECDVVVTNPPFSLFRDFIKLLDKYNKKYLIIGNVNSITYKEVFKLILDKNLWLGSSIHSGDREFRVPNDYPLNAASTRVDEKGNKFIRVKGVRWFTNIDYKERHEDIILYKNFNEEDYPKYENYNAINIDVTNDIPCDYYKSMGYIYG